MSEDSGNRLCNESERTEIQKWYESLVESNCFERWMTELPSLLKDIPLTHLAIPGTHDSMSFGISKSSGISPDSVPFVKALGRFFGIVLKPILYKWCVTQQHSAGDQLSAGIRYFDLRIAVHHPSGKFRFVHGMFAEEIISSLEVMREFLCTHKGEVIILDLQHFYDFNAHHHHHLQGMLNDIFGSMICPVPEANNVLSVTLNWLAKEGQQVIIIYRSPAGDSNRLFWPSKLWSTPWPKTTSVMNLIDFLQSGLQRRPENAGYVTQCVLTPDSWFVVMHIFSNLLSKCAIPCNHAVIPWLKGQTPGRKGVNVVIADYFNFDPVQFPFVQTVVLLNRKFSV